MRVRPVFWFVLIITCLSILAFAWLYPQQIPLHGHIARQNLVSTGLASLELHLTDPQGLPINQAHIVPSAHMTNMDMLTNETHVTPRGNGVYLVQFQLVMAGPWAFTIEARAQGFAPLEQTLEMEVT
jgi:hypothetical protein